VSRSGTAPAAGILGRIRFWLAAAVLATTLGVAATAASAATDDLVRRARAIEIYAEAFPERAIAELEAMIPDADAAAAPARAAVYALYGRSLALAGRDADALGLASRLAADAAASRDDRLAAAALLVRSAVEALTGEAANAEALARQARAQAQGTGPYLPYWAEMAIGVTARTRGHLEESLESLERALALAQQADDAGRTGAALYQLSVVYRALKEPRKALDASLQAFAHAKAAGSAFGMANARMAESAAMEALERPQRELAAMEEALAIARAARSRIIESKALVNLADIHLRRRNFDTALALSRRSLALATEADDVRLIATSKANLGFAHFGLGQVAEGKRLADAAVAYFEASGATAEAADAIAEYALYLEHAGDYRGAVALHHRERKLNGEIALAAHQKTLQEMERKYETERRSRELALATRENDLRAAELANREQQQRLGWLVALVLATSIVVVALMYRKVREANRLLARHNLELRFQNNRDPLTDLYNRRHFHDFISTEGSPGERRRTAADVPPQALMLIDIDHFKDINDRHGHAAGDTVLVAIAQRLRSTLRDSDMVVRWGGEEFLVFVGAAQAAELDEIATRIMAAIHAEPIACQGKALRVTVSIGYAPVPLPPAGLALSWDRAIGLVDMALYLAKLHGRNRAYGILGLARSDAETLAAVERDLEAAWRDGAVDLRALAGPACEIAARATHEAPALPQ
jgi:diguanylate cyclase (GGDEF)-like protein